jgi:small multidrug resistance pump
VSGVLLALAIACEVGATLSLRASNGLRKRIWLVPAIAGYAIAFTCLGLSLQAGMLVGLAYGIWTAVGVVLIATIARVIWKEPLTKKMALGMGLIATGVLLAQLGANH